MRFQKHYTLEEARALLPSVRRWLKELARLHRSISRLETGFPSRLRAGADLGGDAVNRSLKALADIKEALGEFESREILLKDLERGLVDFPSLRDGREVFLCWEQEEDDITHWHDLDAGYAGRERL